MAEIDFQKVLDGMSGGGISSDPIRTIYGILPIYDESQQQIISLCNYYIDKYKLDEMRAMFDKFEEIMSTNKNLGMMSSKVLQNLLSAYTQNEYLRGIKVSTLNNVSDVQQG